MNLGRILFITCLLIFPFNAVQGETLSLKDNLLRITDKIIEHEHDELQKFEKQLKEGTLQRQTFPEDIRRDFHLQQQHYQKLREYIAKASESALPNKLVELFIKKGAQAEYPELRMYLLEAGEKVVLPLARHFDGSNEFVKESILNVLGEITSKEALATVNKSLSDPSIRVQSEGIIALRLINGTQSIPQLHTNLAKTMSVELRLVILEQLRMVHDPKRCELLFDLANKNKIPFQSLINQDLKLCAEQIIGSHLDLILRQFKEKEGNSNQWFAFKLIDQLHSKEYLKQIFPVYLTALKEYYNIGAELENYASIPEPGTHSSEETRRLVERVAAVFNVDDIKSWLQDPLNDPFTRLYLNTLLLDKTHRRKDTILRGPYYLILNVTSTEDEVICNNESELGNGDHISLTCPSIDNFGPNEIRLTTKLDLKKFRIILEDLRIDLKPTPVMFQAELPFGGAYTILLKSNDGKQYSWKFQNVLE